MSRDREPEARGADTLGKMGLEILYAKPGPEDDLTDVAERDLTSELRERFWIRKVPNGGGGRNSSGDIHVTVPVWIERAALGRNRNEPGDGFRYLFRSGTDWTDERVEWFEVTEVFEGVEARNIESFMRLENGSRASPSFRQDEFVRGLNRRIPRRTAQRRAADQVLAAVEKKLSKSSYEGMSRNHGYGTLIVGLPLWFATWPLNPMRVENVVDDFTTRVRIGLKSYSSRLRSKGCPFWRIVVVWNSSAESIREWKRKARLDLYKDPSYWSGGILGASLGPLLLDALETLVLEGADASKSGNFTRWIVEARPEKKERTQHMRLPPAVAEVRRNLAKRIDTARDGIWARIKLRASLGVLALLCFVRVYGFKGLERRIASRSSPFRWVARLVMRRRALRLYRASRRQ